MNYLEDKRSHALASEYVLGTLQGPARVRFQRLLMQHGSMRQILWRWESGLNALGGSLPPQTPPPHLWENIQRQLGFIEDAKPVPNNVVTLPVRKWQWITGMLAAAVIMFAVLLFSPAMFTPDTTLVGSRIAVVQTGKAQALWLIELTANTINVQATHSLQAQQDKDYELWVVAKDGRAPVSLGLLPKQGKLVLPRDAIVDQVDIAALAVSLEPLGGSPNGQPTTVLYTAELVPI